MGGGRLRATTNDRVWCPHSSSAHPHFRHSSAPISPSLRPHLAIPTPPIAIPTQAGTHLHSLANPSSFPNSSLPPSRGEVRWGVGGCERPPTTECGARTLLGRIHISVIPPPHLDHPYTPNRHSCAPISSSLRPQPSFLRRQEPTHTATLHNQPRTLHSAPRLRGKPPQHHCAAGRSGSSASQSMVKRAPASWRSPPSSSASGAVPGSSQKVKAARAATSSSGANVQ